MVSKLSDILPNPANPRTITDSRFYSLSGSLDEFGDLSGVVYNSNPECPALISGHQRMKVFKGAKAKFANVERYDTPEADGTVARGFIQLKDGTLFVYREVQWTKEKSDRATIVANGQFGQWDSDVLANQWDFDVPQLLDMGVPEFVLGLDSEGGIPNNALNSEKLEAKEDDYEIPEEIKTDIVPGDLFEIGPHRLLCGDSTSADDVERIMNGEKADLIITDPPYNVAYEGQNGLKIENDNMSNESFLQFLMDSFSLNFSYLAAGRSVYVWHSDSEGLNFRKAMVTAGIKIRQCLIWVKNSFVMGRQDYQWRHEPCLYGWKQGAPHYFTQLRNKTTVIEVNKPLKNGEHPTMKPVVLIADLMSNSSRPNEIISDPFLGSGTTMVAAHQLNRRCYGIEIDPKYCQVILDRMLKLDPTLEIKRNGQVFTNFK